MHTRSTSLRSSALPRARDPYRITVWHACASAIASAIASIPSWSMASVITVRHRLADTVLIRSGARWTWCFDSGPRGSARFEYGPPQKPVRRRVRHRDHPPHPGGQGAAPDRFDERHGAAARDREAVAEAPQLSHQLLHGGHLLGRASQHLRGDPAMQPDASVAQ